MTIRMARPDAAWGGFKPVRIEAGRSIECRAPPDNDRPVHPGRLKLRRSVVVVDTGERLLLGLELVAELGLQ